MHKLCFIAQRISPKYSDWVHWSKTNYKNCSNPSSSLQFTICSIKNKICSFKRNNFRLYHDKKYRHTTYIQTYIKRGKKIKNRTMPIIIVCNNAHTKTWNPAKLATYHVPHETSITWYMYFMRFIFSTYHACFHKRKVLVAGNLG